MEGKANRDNILVVFPRQHSIFRKSLLDFLYLISQLQLSMCNHSITLLVISVLNSILSQKRNRFINKVEVKFLVDSGGNYYFLYFTLYSGPGSKCLDDPPRIVTLPDSNSLKISDRKLPGNLYNGDTQCKFIYGAGWQQCQALKASCPIFCV